LQEELITFSFFVNLIIYNGKNKGDLVVKNNEKFNITKCGIDVFTL